MAWEQCVERAHNDYPGELVCQERHCQDFQESETYHKNCGKKDPMEPITTVECFNSKTGEVDYLIVPPNFFEKCGAKGKDWDHRSCYCCCSCFATGTRIAVPGGTLPIEEFRVGDPVMVAYIDKQGDMMSVLWKPKAVEFSGGTGASAGSQAMVRVTYGGNSKLVVTPDHLFLTPSGVLIRADRLVPGRDSLVTARGDVVEIDGVELGRYQTGVHHIGTTKTFSDTIEGHLLNSNGVITGDFTVQIHQGELLPAGLLEDPDSRPRLGTDAYREQNAHLNLSQTRAMRVGVEAAPAGPRYTDDLFRPFTHEARIPEHARRFVTTVQQNDILTNPHAKFETPRRTPPRAWRR